MHCSGYESDSDGTGNRETLLEAVNVARAGMIHPAVANARPGAGTIVFLPLHKSAYGFMSDE